MENKRAIKILTDLISLQTVNDRESQVADYLVDLFRNFDVQIERIEFAPQRDNLVMTVGKRGKMLGFSGHEDVVASGDLSQWQTPPFQGTQTVDRKLYGRGASDMKSGLAAMVVALLNLLESKQSLPGRVRLFATVGEETGEYGASQLVKLGYADDLAGMVIGEPSDLKVEVTHKGVIDYCVESTGKAAHSSTPEAGENAILPLVEFAQQAQQLFAQKQELDPVLGGLTHVISQIAGGEQINTVPAQASLCGNIRTIPAYPNEQIYQELDALIASLNQAGAHLKITYRYPEAPLPNQAHSALVQLAQQILQQDFQLSGELLAGTGATEASEYIKVANLPIIIVGPGNQETNHQVNEWVSVDNYLTACAFYQKLIWRFWANDKC
ncbi:ArgE/DapE family deacylase [Bombilactobacillus folatiphilus]|uniref:ArgE/DapE family deacylase n=1 Tax=Bombilactobacillus folatiphilus TaxID=2923362 RepID=A0ABY4P8B7_9LACO|nr:ArgE/DapE family deacylase [Bombilactobacillus folatiphilus]UQS81887.1 ArgE/DapE family deacylase [Bombilactobacillus folatiphilus]